jgi:hypothetical protein
MPLKSSMSKKLERKSFSENVEPLTGLAGVSVDMVNP